MNAPIKEVYDAIAKFNEKSDKKEFDAMTPREMGVWWRAEIAHVFTKLHHNERRIYDSAAGIHGRWAQSQFDTHDRLKDAMKTIHRRFEDVIFAKTGVRV